jgi:hypothetical protein
MLKGLVIYSVFDEAKKMFEIYGVDVLVIRASFTSF